METTKPSGRSTVTPGRPRQVMREHPLFFFFLIAYAGLLDRGDPLCALSLGHLERGFHNRIYPKLFVGPALAAVIMTGITEGKAGLHALVEPDKAMACRAGSGICLSLLGIPALLLLGIISFPVRLGVFKASSHPYW